MLTLAGHPDFPFFYACDETRAVVRAYNAVCTPGFFGNGIEPKLRYQGGLNALQGKQPLEIRRGFFRSFFGKSSVFSPVGNETSWGTKA
ncbi:MAG: hypothetical protein LBI68_04955 [Azoarcus sp.]|jgi:hypothetical protein|nr:hypothetical protein [Azoarcus sp.]